MPTPNTPLTLQKIWSCEKVSHVVYKKGGGGKKKGREGMEQKGFTPRCLDSNGLATERGKGNRNCKLIFSFLFHEQNLDLKGKSKELSYFLLAIRVGKLPAITLGTRKSKKKGVKRNMRVLSIIEAIKTKSILTHKEERKRQAFIITPPQLPS